MHFIPTLVLEIFFFVTKNHCQSYKTLTMNTLFFVKDEFKKSLVRRRVKWRLPMLLLRFVSEKGLILLGLWSA